MQLANLRNFKFSNFSFYHYFFTAYIGLHVTFSILLGKITAFAPDEATYEKLFSKFYVSGFKIMPNSLGFGDEMSPILFLRILYLPAKILNMLGLSELISLRMLAIFYSTLATFLLVRIAQSNGRDDRIFRMALVGISFIPSLFLWSSLGLRESFLYLEIAAILYFLSRIKYEIDIPNLLGLLFSLYCLSVTKNYIFVLFLFAFIFTLIVFSFINPKRFIAHILLLGIVLMPLAMNHQLLPAISNYFNGQVNKVDTLALGDLNNDGRCEPLEPCANGNGNGDPLEYVATGGMTVHYLIDELERDPNTIIAKISSALGITSKLEDISKSAVVVKSDKSVVENEKKLSLQQAGLKKPLQVLESSAKFLLVPFIFVDNGSLFLNIQSIETPIWLFIYGLFFVGLYQVIRRRREFDYAVMIATLFALEFVAISALTEINVGTALRHRSLLLIPILVIWVARKEKPAST